MFSCSDLKMTFCFAIINTVAAITFKKVKASYFLKANLCYLINFFVAYNTNCQRNRLKKHHLNLFTFAIVELCRLFKMSNKVCSVIPFSNHLCHTDTSQRKSFVRFLYSTGWTILLKRSQYYLH